MTIRNLTFHQRNVVEAIFQEGPCNGVFNHTSATFDNEAFALGVCLALIERNRHSRGFVTAAHSVKRKLWEQVTGETFDARIHNF